MFSAFIIGGGDTKDDDKSKTIEIFSPHFEYPFTIFPPYPRNDDGKEGHSQDGLLVCYSSNCWKLSSGGKWEENGHMNKNPRTWHVSWKVTGGVHLIGGDGGNGPGTSSIFVTDDGQIDDTQKFNLGDVSIR